GGKRPKTRPLHRPPKPRNRSNQRHLWTTISHLIPHRQHLGVFMLKRGLGYTLFVLASLVLFAASAAADSRARIVRLSFVEGNVQMDQRDGRGLQKAFLNMPIGQGT